MGSLEHLANHQSLELLRGRMKLVGVGFESLTPADQSLS